MLVHAVRRLALFGAAPILLATATPARAAEAPPTRPTTAAVRSEVVTLTNQQRHANGCGDLVLDKDLTVASAVQSRHMAYTGRHDHVWADGSTFATRARDAGYDKPAGENLAWGIPDVPDVMAAWMKSPHHRQNILNCAARSIGISVTYGTDGAPYYAEVFGYE